MLPLLVLLLVLLLLLLLLELIWELLFLHLPQDQEQVNCWAGGRGLAAGGCCSLRVVSRCWPAGCSSGGGLRVAAARGRCQGDAAWVAILNWTVTLLGGVIGRLESLEAGVGSDNAA